MQHFADLRAVENLDHIAVDFFRQNSRCCRRRDQSEPGDRFELGQPRLGNRRNFGDDGCAFEIGDSQQLDLPVAVERYGGRESIEKHIDMTGNHVGKRGLRAAVGHVHHFDASAHFELCGRQMCGRAYALRGVRELAGIGSAVIDELLQCGRRKIVADHQYVGNFRQHCDRNELRRLVAGITIQQVIERERGGRCDEQRIPVRRRARDAQRADIHGAAGDVLHDGRLGPFLAELVRHDARERVGGRTRDGRHHDFDRSRRIGLLCRAGRRPECNAGRGRERDHSGNARHLLLQSLLSIGSW